jgi:hypothetical protein
MRLALQLGKGDLCLGIRGAVVLASLPQRTAQSKTGMKKVKETADRLEIVTMQMDALAGELRRLGNDPEKREQIVKQIVQLGKLYLTVRAETDLSLQDR